jgi:hypothetical protein
MAAAAADERDDMPMDGEEEAEAVELGREEQTVFAGDAHDLDVVSKLAALRRAQGKRMTHCSEQAALNSSLSLSFSFSFFPFAAPQVEWQSQVVEIGQGWETDGGIQRAKISKLRIAKAAGISLGVVLLVFMLNL